MKAFRFFTLTVAAVALTVALAPRTAVAAKSDEAYQKARADYLKLKGDEKLRLFRHHWLNAQKKLLKAAQGLGTTELGAEAWFTLGELDADCYRFSGQRDDVEAATDAFEKVTRGWPSHRLADDAALLRAQLLEKAGDPAGARKALENAPDGDKKKEIAALLTRLGPARAADKAPEKPVKAGDKTAARAAAIEKLIAGTKSGLARAADPSADKASPKAAEKAPSKVAEQNDDEEKVAAKKVARSDDDEKAAKKPARSDDVEHLGDEDRSAMGEAIRKAILTRDGRRVAPEDPRPTPALPRREPERLSEEDDEGSVGLHFPKISELQERLRDVRVGPAPKPVALTDDPRTRNRLKQIAKDGQGAELTLAEQLGLKMRRVIIDAGHGGHDTGAIGPTGVQEKDVALAIALKTAKKLQDAGLEVVLTRDDDTFVRLEDRSKIANQQRGDLFVSIHCNAAPTRGLRGIETYSLNTSSDHYSARLAARENATAERGVSDLQVILADLATKMNTTESQRLAGRVQRSMVSNLSEHNKGLRDLGTKEALFYVLLGARMPSILVETSFISNPEEEKLLGSDGYQGEVASAIAGAVEAFVSDRDEKLAKVE